MHSGMHMVVIVKILVKISYFTSPLVDEVGALVFDVGTHSSRAGYAGEDTPKVRRQKLRNMLS